MYLLTLLLFVSINSFCTEFVCWLLQQVKVGACFVV